MVTDLCKEKGVKLVLIKAPTEYPYWYEQWDEQVQQFADENMGLPAAHPFWTDAAQPCTQAKAWGGQPFPKDHHWSDDIRTWDLF